MLHKPTPDFITAFGGCDFGGTDNHNQGRDDLPPAASPEDYGLQDEGEASSEAVADIARPRFQPTAIDNIEEMPGPAYLIDRLLPARGLAAIVGAPKSGKSFLATDMLFHVSLAKAYGGRDVIRGPIFYMTGEGVQGFRRRLIALRRHYGVEGKGAPFYMIPNVPDLGSERTDLAQLLQELDSYIRQQDMPAPAAIVLDTLARCMGGGDENSTKDMGRLVNRCGIIEQHFGCLVVVVHHMGKDQTKGSRGSNALNGAADVTIAVKKTDSYSTAIVQEMKDGLEAQEWRFRLVPTNLSAIKGEGGVINSEVATCVVELLSDPASPQPSAIKQAKPPFGVAGDLLKIIQAAVKDVGEINVADVQVPNNTRAVSRENLKKCCIAKDWQQHGTNSNSFRAMLSTTLSRLRDKGQIRFDKEWVWLA